MDPTPWMRPASSGVTLGDAPPTTALERPAASLRCGVRPSVGRTAAQALELEMLGTHASSEAVRLGAANSLVDRAVGKATERIHVAASIVVKRPW